MIRVRLKEAMRRLERASGERVTYSTLAKKTGLSRATIEAIGSRPEYQPSLRAIDLLCVALKCDVEDLLVRTSPRVQRRGSA